MLWMDGFNIGRGSTSSEGLTLVRWPRPSQMAGPNAVKRSGAAGVLPTTLMNGVVGRWSEWGAFRPC